MIRKSIGFSKGQISLKNQNEQAEELYLEPNPTEEDVEEQIRVMEMVNGAMEEAEKQVQESNIQVNYTGTLIHKGFKEDDEKQKMVAYAYKLGGLDFVKVIECENGNWNINAVGDGWKAFGLCQINVNYHKLPDNYKTSRQVQVETCYNKWKNGTKFYWPSRIVKGVKCSSYVSNRFILK